MALCETTKECLSKIKWTKIRRTPATHHLQVPTQDEEHRRIFSSSKSTKRKSLPLSSFCFCFCFRLPASSFQLPASSFSLKWAAAKKTPTSSCVSTSHHLLHHNLSSPNPLHQSPNPPPPPPPVRRNPTRPNSFRSPTITAPDPSKTSPLSSSLFSSLSQLLGSVYSQYVIKIRTITTPLLLFTIPLQVPVLKTHFLTILTIGCLWVLVFLRQNLIF